MMSTVTFDLSVSFQPHVDSYVRFQYWRRLIRRLCRLLFSLIIEPGRLKTILQLCGHICMCASNECSYGNAPSLAIYAISANIQDVGSNINVNYIVKIYRLICYMYNCTETYQNFEFISNIIYKQRMIKSPRKSPRRLYGHGGWTEIFLSAFNTKVKQNKITIKNISDFAACEKHSYSAYWLIAILNV